MNSKCTTASILGTALLAVALMCFGHAMAATAAPAADAAAPEQITPEERLKRNQVSAAKDVGDEEFRREQDKALGGDREAALKVAQMFKTGSNSVPKDERRMLQWLLQASSLNNGAASYQLYQYYLDQKLDRDAVFFENRAIDQGFILPPRLDPRRG
jgi:TPR repeat protein